MADPAGGRPGSEAFSTRRRPEKIIVLGFLSCRGTNLLVQSCFGGFQRESENMKTLSTIFGIATATALVAGGLMNGRAEAAPMGGAADIAGAADGLQLGEDVQYFYRGRRHCWYEDGWRGPGWYWCGYNMRQGYGWGGGSGWQGWRRDGGREGDYDRGRRRGGDYDRGRDWRREGDQRRGDDRRGDGRRGDDRRGDGRGGDERR